MSPRLVSRPEPRRTNSANRCSGIRPPCDSWYMNPVLSARLRPSFSRSTISGLGRVSVVLPSPRSSVTTRSPSSGISEETVLSFGTGGRSSFAGAGGAGSGSAGWLAVGSCCGSGSGAVGFASGSGSTGFMVGCSLAAFSAARSALTLSINLWATSFLLRPPPAPLYSSRSLRMSASPSPSNAPINPSGSPCPCCIAVSCAFTSSRVAVGCFGAAVFFAAGAFGACFAAGVAFGFAAAVGFASTLPPLSPPAVSPCGFLVGTTRPLWFLVNHLPEAPCHTSPTWRAVLAAASSKDSRRRSMLSSRGPSLPLDRLSSR